jgi:tryptophan synthase beta chain
MLVLYCWYQEHIFADIFLFLNLEQCAFHSTGGLRYHGMAPLISHVYELGFMEALAIPQTECFQGISYFSGLKLIVTILCTIEVRPRVSEDRLRLFLSFVAGAIQFARSEGLIPAPEPTHAIAATIREALRCRETGESKVILTAMCGHGHFDLPAYEKYLQGNMVDLSFSEVKIQASMANIPHVAA